MTRYRTLGRVLAATVLASGFFIAGHLAGFADAQERSLPALVDSLPACAVEDGSHGPNPCYWDASEQGNGLGHDVIIGESR